MVREMRRSLLGLALVLAAGAVMPLQAQQRYKVLIPNLRPEGGAERRFGEQVARELRELVDDMNTHQSVAEREMDQGFRRLRIDHERVDCDAAKQLATDAEYPLALCASYTPAGGGMTITAEFIDVRSGDALTVTPRTVAADAASEAARHMFDEFSSHVEEIRATAICSDYVNSEIWDQGLEACSRAVEVNPRAIGPRMQIFRVYFQTQRFPEALETLEGVLGINPEHQDALQMAGYVASQIQQDQESLAYYNRYLEVVPGDATMRTQVAYQVAQAGDPVAAMELIQKGVDHDPSNLDLREQLAGYAFSAGAKINSARTDSSSAMAPEAVPLFRKAIEAYEHLFEARGAETPVAHLRSVVSAYLILGEMDNAVAFGERAVQAQPDDPDLWWVQADALSRAGRIPEALAALDRVVALQPDHPMAGLRRGEWLLAADRLSEATTALRDVATKDPSQADAAGGLLVAHAYAKGVQPRRWNAAIPVLEAARGIPGLSTDTNHQINFWLGFSIMQGTIPQQEARTVETARAALPRFQRARELLGMAGNYPQSVRIDLGQLIQAVEQYIEIQETIIRRGR